MSPDSPKCAIRQGCASRLSGKACRQGGARQSGRCSRLIRRLAPLLLILLQPAPLLAIQASPHEIQESQPDGSVISLRIRGDEYFHWYEDLQGYSVVRDRGRYLYARLGKANRLTPTAWEVGKADPAAKGLQKRILPPAPVMRQLRSARLAMPGSAAATTAAAVTGTFKNLVIMLRFSDHAGRTLPSGSDVETLFNAPGGDFQLAPTGSVRDVFIENSYGQLVLDSTVVGWIDLPNTELYYADGVSGTSSRIWEALTYALDQVDTLIDFNDYDEDNDGFIDSIAFIHSGYGAEWGGTDAAGAVMADRIWSHRWAIQLPPLNSPWTSSDNNGAIPPQKVKVFDYHISPGLWGLAGTSIGRIGVIAHETGHFFGLPDLYDTDGSPGEGIGSWGLMANAWGFDLSQLFPPHLSAWSKIELGWITPTAITAPGTYSIPEVENNPVVYRIDANYPAGEYLLIENRQPLGFDGVIPQGGLAIYHIDELAGFNTEGYPGQAGWPDNGNHYRVALLQADGNYDLEQGFGFRGDAGDVYHALGVAALGPNTIPDTHPNTDAYQTGNIIDTANQLLNISPSGSSMSFDYSDTPPPPSPVNYFVRTEHYEADWIDATVGIQYSLADDGSVTLPTGFDFDFYGTLQTTVTISANGYLTFGPAGGVAGNTSLPDAAVPNELIAPFWDDLNPEEGGAVYVHAEGTAPYRRLTIAWVDIPRSGLGGVTFEATLYEANGDIVFRYLDVDFGDASHDRGASATIGVENAAGDAATVYSHNQALIQGFDALRFSRLRDVLLVDDDDNTPDVRGYYTAPLDALGVSYDNWDTASSGDPGSTTLASYKNVIWFTGDKFDIAEPPLPGPEPAGEVALGAFLDAGGCMFISAQDYYYTRGLTVFMSAYLGASAVGNDVQQVSVAGVNAAFGALGPYILAYPPGFGDYSDTISPDVGAAVAFTGDKGNAAITKTTTSYSTSFWGFPFAAIPTATDRLEVMDKVLRFCANVHIDSDADGSANSVDPDDDNDGLSDLTEVTLLGTSPYLADTDADGLTDFEEVNRDDNPNDYNPAVDTSPLLADTDADGFSDRVELEAGSNPLDPASIPDTGDINGDGLVDVVDILFASRALLGQITLTNAQLTRGDVAPLVDGIPSPDGLFTLGDALLIQRKALGQISF